VCAALLACSLLCLTGCKTTVGEEGASNAMGGAPGTSGPVGGDTPGGVEVQCDSSVAGVTPLTKLSTVQYRNTVRDLVKRLGLDEVPTEIDALLASIPDDSTGQVFRGLDDRVSTEHVQGYFNVGVALGDALQNDAALLEEVAGACATAATLSDDCAKGFLESFLLLAFRRPPSAAELDEFSALNDGVRSPAQAIRAMVIVALSSPRFVYHVEIDGREDDDDASLLEVDPFELANRLSYTFWQTMPDEALLASAADGSLATPDGYGEQLERVFEDDRSSATLWQFWKEWLLLEKFTGFETTRPAFQSLTYGEGFGESGHDHYADMVEEVRELTALFTFEQKGTLAELLTTNLSVTSSEDLARIYGVEPYSGSGPYPTLPEGERAGLLQRAALLASNLEQTNPFHRGALVRRNILCDALPRPDPNSLPPGSLDPPPLDEEQTTRERFAAKVESALCQECHATFSDIGYVLESFDAIGRYRTVERVYDETNGELLAELPIDVAGDVSIASKNEAPVEGPLEMNQRIVESGKVDACFAKNYFEYATRRTATTGSLDACAVRALAEVTSGDAESGDSGLFTAFQSIARYPGFFQRKVGAQ
jgi:hypothetical protein